MEKIIKKDIISVLSNVIDILCVAEEKDTAKLRDLSNHTIHNASVFQDESSISIAILIYSLSKVIERKQKQIDCSVFVDLLKKARKDLENDNIVNYNKTIKKIFDIISKIDDKLRLYIGEVINQAQIKKGSKIYEHGISSARTAEILGISQWELMNYIGKTTIAEVDEKISNLDKRIKFARGLFS